MGYEEKCNLSYPMHLTDTIQFVASRIPRKEQKREQEIWWTILEI